MPRRGGTYGAGPAGRSITSPGYGPPRRGPGPGVDAAHAVGSVPDGWWRDHRGAAERLRDRPAADGLPGRPGPVEAVLVVEGAARGVEPVPGVRVESAPGRGDDRMVALVAGAGGRPDLVVTAGREPRRRVSAPGAGVAGPRSVAR